MRKGGRLFGGKSLFRFIPRAVNIGEPRADGKKCILCKKCEKACATHAIHVDKENRKWYIYPGNCIKCYRCINRCPKNAIKMFP
ncbi:4Fe-4S dicluster domain-containing protein [Methanobrevibacter ruminantium]|uniref:NADH-quinone oxidoreductase subunit I n=1 Tax=Methanobrevibacter ruminantium TaxID=83816 RepID=UPI0026F28DFD|nr:4Fe-4S dicluster domain-containing protein [Methanobrevibacter ruminantium]